MCRIVEENIQGLYGKLTECYNAIPERVVHFGGPPIYFHLRAIEEGRRNFLSDSHLEMVYAALTSWGMHSMRGGPKLINFADFRASILRCEDIFKKLRAYNILTVSEAKFNALLNTSMKEVFLNLKLNVARTILVVNAKALHHILPDLVMPIDGQYVCNFFNQDRCNSTDEEQIRAHDYRMFKYIIMKSKEIVERKREFFEDKRELIVSQNTVPFNSSIPKLLDNMIMVYEQIKKDQEKKEKGKIK